VRKDIEELYMKQVQRVMDKGKTKHMPRMLLSIPCYLVVEEGYGGFTYSV